RATSTSTPTMRRPGTRGPRPACASRTSPRPGAIARFSRPRLRSRPMHVCLIAEGSYPYVTGGVGKWTHDLISSLPAVEFTVISLWPPHRPEPQPRYPTPPNVREMRTSFVLTPAEPQARAAKDLFDRLETFHHAIKKGNVCPFANLDSRIHLEDLRTN